MLPTHLCLCKLLWTSEIMTPKDKQTNCSTSSRDEELESCLLSERPKKLCEISMTTNHNPTTLPINLHAVGPPDVKPLDLSKLGDHHSVQHMPQKEVKEFMYTSNQIVWVKDGKGDSERHLGTSLPTEVLQKNAWYIKVMAKMFVRVQLNPMFSEDPEKYNKEESLICFWTSYKQNQDILELTALFNNTRTLNRQKRFSLPSIKCSAGPPSLRLLPNSVRCLDCTAI